MKPVWQVPSKEVRKIFQRYYRRPEFRLKTEEPDGKSPMARGDTNLAAGVVPEEKDLCYGIRYQGKGVCQAHKAEPTNPSGLTGLVVWEGSVKVGGWVECEYWGSE